MTRGQFGCIPRQKPNASYHVSDTEEAKQEMDEEKQVRVTIRVAPEVKESLQMQAKELDMSVSGYIALLVMRPYDDESDETD